MPLVKQWKEQGQICVLANGTFDPLHFGHVLYLTSARCLGDYLLVAVNDDTSVRRLKGSQRPILPIHSRLMAVAAIEGVDAAFPFHEDNLEHVLAILRPNIHCKGSDYPSPQAIPEFSLSSHLGIQSVIVGGPKIQSSSRIIRHLFR